MPTTIWVSQEFYFNAERCEFRHLINPANYFQLSPPPQDPIYLICPRNVWTYLSEYGEIEDTGVQDVELVCPIFCEEIEHRMLHNRVDRPSW